MSEKWIEVTISPDGNTTRVVGHGFGGHSCLDAMANLENKLGEQIGMREMHPEPITAQQAQELQQ